jgi:hypothetical protein
VGSVVVVVLVSVAVAELTGSLVAVDALTGSAVDVTVPT